jgi:hypothetical protein
MKSLKSRTLSRLPAKEALRISAEQAPTLPPAQLSKTDPATTLNLRVRVSTITALAEKAKASGLTQKQVICRALAEAGVDVAVKDLEDRTPRRKNV